MSDNYADETKPLFKLLRTEAFRFVIVRYNHFSLVQQLEKDLKSLFPNRPLHKVDAQKSDYQRISKDYFSLENGFFFIQNFDSLLKEDRDRFGKETPLMSAENERRRHITAGLNLRRDKLAKYPIALFVFLPALKGELHAKIIMEKMPDLWSFRSIILDLETTKVSDKGNLKEKTLKVVGDVSVANDANKNNQVELNRLLALLKKTPKNEVAYRLTLYPQIVDIAIALGNYKEALSMLDKWKTNTGDNDKGEIWLKKGEILADMGGFDEAQKHLAKALTLFEKSQNDFKIAVTFFRLGNNYGDQSEYEKAIASFEKAVKIKPDLYEAFNNMGLAYSEKKEYDKAIECYQKAIEIKPNFDEAFYNIGLAYHDKKDNDKAIKYYGIAIEIKPNYHEAFLFMGIAYFWKGEYDKAIECYKKVIEIKPDYSNAFYLMGNAYSNEGEYDKAIECYQKAITGKRKVVHEAFYGIGYAYESQGDNKKAIHFFEQAINIKPNFREAYGSLGFCYMKIGSINEAEPILLKAIELGDNDTSNMNLGHVYLCKNEEEKAIECYKTSLSHFENKDKFWEGMKDDYQYLVQYGITEAYYQSVLEKIR
jgi:tetratricopeptide (TPR) repeat protein